MSSAADWQELHCIARKDQIDPLEKWFFAAGALSVTLEDQANQTLLEPGPGETPLWEAVRVTALFAGDQDLSPVLEAVPGELVAEAPQTVVLVADREWTRVWEDQFQPMQMGKRLWICPSWTPPPEPGALNLLLDPGLAFGTGMHSTTAMCLKALDAASLENTCIVDYGCGSGILGIAAALLGAQQVLGVDNDPQAITASLDNASRNQISAAQFSASLPTASELEDWKGSADWVVANILAGPLIDLAPALTTLMAPKGRLLLAGLLEEQTEQIVAAYAPEVMLTVADQQEEWVLLAGHRPFF